jgi:hypothetical protein
VEYVAHKNILITECDTIIYMSKSIKKETAETPASNLEPIEKIKKRERNKILLCMLSTIVLVILGTSQFETPAAAKDVLLYFALLLSVGTSGYITRNLLISYQLLNQDIEKIKHLL